MQNRVTYCTLGRMEEKMSKIELFFLFAKHANWHIFLQKQNRLNVKILDFCPIFGIVWRLETVRIQTRSCKHIHEAFGTFCQVFQAAAFCPYASTIITKSAADSRSHLKLFTFVATPCDFGVVRIAAAKKKSWEKSVEEQIPPTFILLHQLTTISQ